VLKEEELKELEPILGRYPTRRGAAIDALRIVQRHRGWVSDRTLSELADHLGMTVHELDSVATFYNLIFRRPVGRHVILLCDSVSCWILGADTLRGHLEKRLGVGLGETTEDDRFTLLPMACLGCCDGALALMIDEDTHRDLDPEKLDRILERYE